MVIAGSLAGGLQIDQDPDQSFLVNEDENSIFVRRGSTTQRLPKVSMSEEQLQRARGLPKFQLSTSGAPMIPQVAPAIPQPAADVMPADQMQITDEQKLDIDWPSRVKDAPVQPPEPQAHEPQRREPIQPAISKVDLVTGRLQMQNQKIKGDYRSQLQKMDRAFVVEEEQMRDAQKAGELRGTEEAAHRRELARQHEVDRVIEDEKEASRKTMINREMNKYKALQQEVLDGKIDPNAFWADKSTAQKVGLIISHFVSGVGAAMAGRDVSKAMGWLDRMVNRDIDAQKFQLANKRVALSEQGNLISMTRTQFDDERASDSAVRALKWQGLEEMTRGLDAQAQSTHMKEKYAQILAEIGVRKSQAEGDLLQTLNQNILSNLQLQLQGAIAGGGRGRGTSQDTRIVGMKYTGERVLTPKEAAKINDARAELLGVLSKAEKLITHVSEFGKEAFGSSDASRKGKQLSGDILLALKNIYELGVLSESDIKLLSDQIPADPHEVGFYSQTNTINQIKSFIENATSTWGVRAQQAGLIDLELGPSIGYEPGVIE